jgi:hypothetical protein
MSLSFNQTYLVLYKYPALFKNKSSIELDLKVSNFISIPKDKCD